jgi:hypothetical protein
MSDELKKEPAETWWSGLKDHQAEEFLKEKMKDFDPAKMDFSEQFFDHLHDKIMTEIEKREIQPKTKKTPWYRLPIQFIGKSTP